MGFTSTTFTRWTLALFWLALATATHWPRLQLPGTERLSYDKLVHTAVFALLTLWLVAARLAGPRADAMKHLVVGTLLAAAYAYLDEVTQPLTQRHFSMADLLGNLAGVLGVFAVLLPLAVARTGSRWGSMVLARVTLICTAPFAMMMVLIPGLNFDMPLGLPMGPHTGEIFEPRMDHILHLLGAMTLTWLLAASRPFGRHHPITARAFTVFLLLMLGPAIELFQERIGRGFEWGDLIAHEIGVCIGVIVGAGYLLAMRAAQRGAGGLSDAYDSRPRPADENTGAMAGKPAGFVRGAAVVSSLTFVSRITGLLRESVIAAAFGRGPVADAFIFGFQIPNLFRRLFGEGALSAALIPLYADLLHRDRLTAGRLASVCLALLGIVLGITTIIGETLLTAALIARPWSPGNELAIRLAMIMLPYMPLVCLVAVIGSILQVHDRFASTAAAPIVLNVVVIAAALIGAGGSGDDADLRRTAYIVSYSVVLAGILQLLWQLAAVVRVEKFTRVFVGTRDALTTLMRRFLPMAIGLGIFQINTFLDNVIAMGLRVVEGGATHLTLFNVALPLPLSMGDVAALGWAQRLYEFPLGIFGIAIATAIFPALARAAARRAQGAGDFRAILQQGLRLTVFIGLPASAGLLLIGLPLVRIVFERRQFTLEDSHVVSFILAGYAPAIWAYSMNHVITRGFYSLGDTRTPLMVSTAMVALNLLLNLTLVWYLGAAGFAWSTAVCAVLQAVVMLLAIRHYVAWPVDRYIVLGWARSLGLTLAMAAALYPLTRRYDASGLSHAQAALQVTAMVALGAAIFALGAWITRAEELRWLLRRK